MQPYISSRNLFYNPQKTMAQQALNEYYPQKFSKEPRNYSIHSDKANSTKLKSILNGTIKPKQTLNTKNSFNTSNNSTSNSFQSIYPISNFQELLQTNINSLIKSPIKENKSNSIGISPQNQFSSTQRIQTSPKINNSINQNSFDLLKILKTSNQGPLSSLNQNLSQNLSCASLSERINKINSSRNEKKIQQAQKIIQTLKQELSNQKKMAPVSIPVINQFPMSGLQTIKKFGSFLTEQEKKEIIEYEDVYFLGSESKKFENAFDNDQGDFIFNLNDQIAFRYQMIDKLGKGSFGQVFKVHDHKRKVDCALKIIKNSKRFYCQALIEISILKDLRESDNLVKMRDYFIFREHVCIVFELLDINLYQFLKQNYFRGINLDLIRRFSIQILQGLFYLNKKQIIHCDLKPENILLKERNKSGLKIIDFGSSCYFEKKMYTYIQSRFYRSPEIILGLPYSCSIDWWSFGCILVELYSGQPLFPSDSEKDHLLRMMEVLGNVPRHMVEQSEKIDKLIDEEDVNRKCVGSKPIEYLLKMCPQNFIDFVKGFLCWDGKNRMDPGNGLVHEWILEGLPEQLKTQHLKQMKELAPELRIFREKQKKQSIVLDNNNKKESRQKNKRLLEHRVNTLQNLLRQQRQQ